MLEDDAENTAVELWRFYELFIICKYRFDPDELWAHSHLATV